MQTEHYLCTACGWFGDEPRERIEREYYEVGIREVAMLRCPNCELEALDERVPCEECGEAPAEVEDWCKECHTSLEARGLLIDL